ncbi:MAG: putative permease [Burkholderia sp.]|nr:putative permease [Burkholderia sp.]
MNDSASAASANTLLGHPKGLFVLFFTEMWERFSYYGMRALLVLYMTGYLFAEIEKGKEVVGFQMLRAAIESLFGPLTHQALSSQIYGLYTGFVYLTPVFGGLIADRFIGQKRSVYWGAVLMGIGHFLMASERLFLLALLFLIVGNGFFKPNISTQVASLYSPTDARRDRAYMIFYMGVNLGAFFAPLVCGTLGQKIGWHYGFGAAGVGMILAITIFHFGQKHLGPELLASIKTDKAAALRQRAPLTPDEWKRVIALMIVCAVTVLFWGIYEQQGNTLQLLADQQADWQLFGWTMPSSWFQSFNPLLIFVLTPFLNRYWGWQSARGKEPASIKKMGLGCVIMGLGFALLLYLLHGLPAGQKLHWVWLFACVFFFTVGEIYLSPVGLSFVTKIAPAKIVSMMMGVWLLASFFGNYLAGYLGIYYQKLGPENFFGIMIALSLAATALLLLLARGLRDTVRGA